MKFWVFSYNRGSFLQNCIESLERCAPQCEVAIFDDNSTDAETQSILAKLKARYKIITPEGAVSQSKHGGLYNNMQSVYERSTPEGLICFIQDDTQLVRPISNDELLEIGSFLSARPDVGFLQPAFMRGCNKAVDGPLTRYNRQEGLYYVDRLNSSAGAFYSDVFIARIQTLRAAGWRFLKGEPLNEQQARSKFGQMGYLKNPFVAWLPNVPAYRGKTQTRALRLAHRLRACGYYPFTTMSSEQSREFCHRDEGKLPFAEDYLSVTTGRPRGPWIYNPLQGSGWLKQLDRLERAFIKPLRRK